MPKPIKVLIVDDSALVRELLARIISRERGMEVLGTANDPLYAIKKIKEERPDVITLDLEMPRMDGLTFLEKLMASYPLPVVVISSLAREGSEATLRALELGAVDYISKPTLGLGSALEELAPEIIGKIRNAAAANMEVLRRQVRQERIDRLMAPAELIPDLAAREPGRGLVQSTDKVIAIGASTGGTVAVKNILSKLPANLPGILVVLHMPAGFTASYAASLNNFCRLRVKEAQDGDPLVNGSVLVAPGGKHMLLSKGASGFIVRLDNGPPVNRHRPSVDKTFFSVAQNASGNSLGIILTGMGDDGARGLKAMHDAGALTIAQDEQSSVVFGMPKQAIAAGAVDKILPLDDIGGAIVSYVRG